uniref:hypothetical protein n=1 Tax=Haslea pseudostrearia TaxID=197756 RepID=UPI0021FEC133|nr:hypothetical protein ON958_pgp037 [Haslea pseudostrearia]UXN44663.1 hypothetical protein [Haslea pseudostrearia]
MKINRIVLRYLVFVIIPYLIANSLEKLVWKHADSKSIEKIRKELPDFEKLSEHSKYELDKRGGVIDPILAWLTKVKIANFAIKVAIGGAVSASIWSETADNAAAQLGKIRKRDSYFTRKKICTFIQ